jgi:hypothetical protein
MGCMETVSKGRKGVGMTHIPGMSLHRATLNGAQLKTGNCLFLEASIDIFRAWSTTGN